MKNLTLMKILAFQTAGDSHVCKTALLSMSNTEDYNYHSLPENNYFFSLSLYSYSMQLDIKILRIKITLEAQLTTKKTHKKQLTTNASC